MQTELSTTDPLFWQRLLTHGYFHGSPRWFSDAPKHYLAFSLPLLSLCWSLFSSFFRFCFCFYCHFFLSFFSLVDLSLPLSFLAGLIFILLSLLSFLYYQIILALVFGVHTLVQKFEGTKQDFFVCVSHYGTNLPCMRLNILVKAMITKPLR